MGIGFINGLFGILLFIVISQDYEPDKIYNFDYNKYSYQTRRYSFSFATIDDTKYTFKTYKKCRYLPFENQINKIILYGFNNKINFNEKGFDVCIKNSVNK